MEPDYISLREGDWRLWVVGDGWSQSLWETVRDRVAAQIPSKRAQTIELRYPETPAGNVYFLKVFHCQKGFSFLKDLLRDSKALRSLRQGASLSRLGFNVPLTLAAGEQRRFRSLRRSFALARGVGAEPLYLFLDRQYDARPRDEWLLLKRVWIREFAAEVRRFHQLGFVHGDLVASNILVAEGEGEGVKFFFIDNDRTRRYPEWLPQKFWKRNLVQLNRLSLRGITLRDRMRFLKYYLMLTGRMTNTHQLIRWLAAKARQKYDSTLITQVRESV